MGKKKRFDKKGAYHFTLLHRSQLDPLYHSENGSSMVLHPSDERTALALEAMQELAQEKNGMTESGFVRSEFVNYTAISSSKNSKDSGMVKELREVDEYGFPLDGYDYSQHLAEIGDGMFIDASGTIDLNGSHKPVNTLDEKKLMMELPKELFASDHELPRMLEAITLKPDRMDPDMLIALEEAEDMFEDVDEEGPIEELQEDFMEQLLELEKSAPKDSAFDYDAHVKRLMAEADDEEDEFEDDDDFGDFEAEKRRGKNKKTAERKVRFDGAGDDNDDNDQDYEQDDAAFEDDGTIVPENLVGSSDLYPKRGIDEHLDALLEEYDDDEIGELDDVEFDETVGGELENDAERVLNVLAMHSKLMQEEVREGRSVFGKHVLNQKSKDNEEEQEQEEQKQDKISSDSPLPNDTDLQEFEAEQEAMKVLSQEVARLKIDDMMGSYKIKPKSQWDAETIVSTYSILDNHPQRIEVALPKKKSSKAPGSVKSRASNEDDVLIKDSDGEDDDEIDDENDQKEEENHNSSIGRNRKETPEERRLRKQKVKEQKRSRREEKKNTKILYSQAMAQGVAISNNNKSGIKPGVSIMKL